MKKKIITFCAAVIAAATASAFEVGPLDIGGAIRANYVNGSYDNNGTDGPQRGSHGGNFEFDTFRINLDYQQGPYLGKVEYRWYDGYNFFHTAWVGYDFEDESQLQLGLNRVPFGVGPYGPANSWFFDQHYYVGLSDDMDLGFKYTIPLNNLTLDAAYYPMQEPNGWGSSLDSARYGYDPVDEKTDYSVYEQRNQIALRAIYSLADLPVPTDLGVSGLGGQLDSRAEYADDSYYYAGAIHSKSTLGPWRLMAQLSHYDYQAEYENGALDMNDNPLTDDLIGMGAYNFAWPVASRGTIPSVALSYTWEPADIDFIDAVTFYNDWSVILKDGETADGKKFNDSMLNVTGFSIANGGWFIYVDYALSDGNYFVGNEGDDYSSYETVGDFGVNGNDKWNHRFNVNFGYYF
jgi:hypothetical protein